MEYDFTRDHIFWDSLPVFDDKDIFKRMNAGPDPDPGARYAALLDAPDEPESEVMSDPNEDIIHYLLKMSAAHIGYVDTGGLAVRRDVAHAFRELKKIGSVKFFDLIRMRDSTQIGLYRSLQYHLSKSEVCLTRRIDMFMVDVNYTFVYRATKAHLSLKDTFLGPLLKEAKKEEARRLLTLWESSDDIRCVDDYRWFKKRRGCVCRVRDVCRCNVHRDLDAYAFRTVWIDACRDPDYDGYVPDYIREVCENWGYTLSEADVDALDAAFEERALHITNQWEQARPYHPDYVAEVEHDLTLNCKPVTNL